jgi:hypothetical protein
MLALLEAIGGQASNTDFQKLLFLFSQETADPPLYEFVPYKYGAFSFTSYADRLKLIEKGLLIRSNDHWELAADGEAAIYPESGYRSDAASFVSRLGWMRGSELIAYTYKHFPYYATHSEIASEILSSDSSALAAIRNSKPSTSNPGLVTIGYEGKSIEAYLNLLLQDCVTLLCDVRRNPISRKYGFSKRVLAYGCSRVGIKYEHLPQLGIESGKRHNLSSQEDYNDLFATYLDECLPRQEKELSIISSWIESGERVALTCYEADVRQCHRGCVASIIQCCSVDLQVKHL